MKRFSKSSSRNSNKSLSSVKSAIPTSQMTAIDKHENLYKTQRSSSMEALHAEKIKDLKMNGGITYNENKISCTDLLSRKKKLSYSTPSTPVPSSYNREYSYTDSILRSNNHSAKDQKSSNQISSGILTNIENQNIYNSSNYGSSNEMDKDLAEQKLGKLRQELDRKRIFIKNMKMSLESVDHTDNIDIRIQQAELEYQLGREELNLLNILEEFRNLQNSLENNFYKPAGSFHDNSSIYSYIVKYCSSSDTLTIHAVQIPYDSKSPRFGLSYREDAHGFFIEWARDDCGLCKGDRILEINNNLIVHNNNKTEIIKLLKLLPNTKLVILRNKKQPSSTSSSNKENRSERIEDTEKIQYDNVRLTHRICYLEEQVADLLKKVNKDVSPQTTSLKTKRGHKYLETSLCSKGDIKYNLNQRYKDESYSNKDSSNNNNHDDEEVEVFQKGTKIKTLLKNHKYNKETPLERAKTSIEIKYNKERITDDRRQHDKSVNSFESSLDSLNTNNGTLENIKSSSVSLNLNDLNTSSTYLNLNREDTKENSKTLYNKTPEKYNSTNRYYRRKKSETNIYNTNTLSTYKTKSNVSDTETYTPTKSKSLIYLNKSSSDYNYPITNNKSLKNIHGLMHNADTIDLSKEHDKYNIVYTFPIIKYNSDKNIRKVLDNNLYDKEVDKNSEETRTTVSNDTKDTQTKDKDEHVENNISVLGETIKNKNNDYNSIDQTSCSANKYDEELKNDDTKVFENKIRIEYKDEIKSNEIGIIDELNNNELYDYKKKVFTTLHETCINNIDKIQENGNLKNKRDDHLKDYDRTREQNGINCRERYSDIDESIENDNVYEDARTRTGRNYSHEYYNGTRALDRHKKSTESKYLNRSDDSKHHDDSTSNHYDDFVRSRQSLDRIYDKYFYETELNKIKKQQQLQQEQDGRLKDEHSNKNKFKNEKYVDIDDVYDNNLNNSKNVEKLNNNFKEFWKIKNYKNKMILLNNNKERNNSNIEKSKSETSFNDYEKRYNDDHIQHYDEHKKFNENTRMSKYEDQSQRLSNKHHNGDEHSRQESHSENITKYQLDDQLEKEKLQKSFLMNNYKKPIPPKKPARLSLQRAASLQSVNSIVSIMTHNSDSQTKKPIKRNYKGDSTYLTSVSLNCTNEKWC